MKYRKKPVVIEAMQWVSDMPDRYLQSVFDWLDAGGVRWTLSNDARCITITTLEGDMLASDGDYIIRGVQGEFYPCKPDIFDATYEAVR